MAAQIQRARRTGLTFAPEAGTWRMRQVINKLITEDDLFAAVDSAFSQGWKRVKLYFLTGLPTETDEDTLGIVDLARRCVDLAKAKGLNGSVTVSVGGFVPKAFTPFQWFGMNTEEELRRKVGLLRDAAKGARNVNLKWHDPKASLIEGLVSRGDRRLGPVIEHVWRAGGTFQEWGEHFRLDLWQDAMAAHGLELDWYTHRHRTEDEVLPWDHLSAGLHKDFLWQDWRDALEELGLEDCRWTPCYDCGACTGYGIEHVVASAVPPAGGSQGTGQGLAFGVPVELSPATGGGGRVRARLRFTKLGKLRFLSHRDLARIWERSLRRAGVQVAYSEGFSPRPRLHFGLALSTGHESLAEYLDIDLVDGAGLEPADLPEVVADVLPAGIAAQIAVPIGPGTDSLQQAVTSCRWEIEVVGPEPAAVADALARTLAATALPTVVERKGSRGDLDARPAIVALTGRRAELVVDLSRVDPSGRARCSSPSSPPNPAASAPRSSSEPSTPPGSRVGCCEPTNGRWSTAPAASRSPSPRAALVARRRPRTPERVRHEKGSPR